MFERVLVAIDGSEPANEALTAAAGVAGRFGSTVEVLHVQGHKLTWAADLEVETREEAIALVKEGVRQLHVAGVEATGDVVHAPVDQIAHEIVRVANDLDSSLIVLGTRGFGDAASLLLGSVAHAVLHRAPCPVLLTPHADPPAAVHASTSPAGESADVG